MIVVGGAPLSAAVFLFRSTLRGQEHHAAAADCGGSSPCSGVPTTTTKDKEKEGSGGARSFL